MAHPIMLSQTAASEAAGIMFFFHITFFI